jgi:hypothetical protein
MRPWNQPTTRGGRFNEFLRVVQLLYGTALGADRGVMIGQERGQFGIAE